MSRRRLIVGAAAGTAALAMPAVWTRANAQENSLVVGVPGGYGDAWDTAFFKPFTEATGIGVTSVIRRDNAAAEFQVSVETGNYAWDVGAAFTEDLYHALSARGFAEELDLTGPNISAIDPSMKHSGFVGYALYTFLLAYRTDVFPQGVNSFADVWDLQGFPGRRSLRRHYLSTIEIAMRAAGVAPADVYTELGKEGGWDKAFAKLDEIKEHVDVWWEGGAQAPQILQTNEVDLCPAFSQRIQPIIDEGAPVAMNWNQSFWTMGGWMIPKGNPKAALGRQLVEFCSGPKPQADFMVQFPLGPTHPDAFSFFDEETAKKMTTYPANFSQSTPQNQIFWMENAEYASTRFNEWLLLG